MERPCLYHKLIEPHLEKIREMAKTMTERQIAEYFGVSYTGAWIPYKKKFPELEEAVKKSRADLVVELKSTLIKRAKGYRYKEKKTVTERIKWTPEARKKLLEAGLTPSEIDEARLIKTEETEKEAAPDVAAINLALKNWDKENWSNDPQMLAVRKEELKLRKKQIENNEW